MLLSSAISPQTQWQTDIPSDQVKNIIPFFKYIEWYLGQTFVLIHIGSYIVWYLEWYLVWYLGWFNGVILAGYKRPPKVWSSNVILSLLHHPYTTSSYHVMLPQGPILSHWHKRPCHKRSSHNNSVTKFSHKIKPQWYSHNKWIPMIWSQQFDQHDLVTMIESQNSITNCPVTRIWSQKIGHTLSGHNKIVTYFWSVKNPTR